MFKAIPRGALTVNGVAINSEELARLVGTTVEEVEKCLTELGNKKVYSKLGDGTIINRRMYHRWTEEGKLHEARSLAGKKGAEATWRRGKKDVDDGKEINGTQAG
jgi:hypothetical protein